MRFMMIVRANKESEAGVPPPKELIEAMGKFNEEMVNAGVMLSGDGLHPSSQGARVHFKGGKPTVTDGPFAETKELIAGFWIIQVKDKAEAIEWAKRCPAPFGEDQEGELELRRIFEAEDFPPESMSPEELEREKRLRAEMDAKRSK